MIISVYCQLAHSLPLQTFPNHYHPTFLGTFAKKRNKSPKIRSKEINTTRENDEDRRKYGGMSERHFREKFLGPYIGNYAWTSRLGQLTQSIDHFEPSKAQHLNFYHTSQLLESRTSSKETRVLRETQEQVAVVKDDLKPVETLKKVWYKEPFSQTQQAAGTTPDVDLQMSFGLQFVTGMPKQASPTLASGLQASSTEPLAPSRFCYQNRCILPSASNLMHVDSSVTVVHVTFTSGTVVGYYGVGSKGDSQGEVQGGVSPTQSLVVGMAMYRTESLSYTVAR